MATRALTAVLRCAVNKSQQTRSLYTIQNKIGNREIVGFGVNSEPIYIDATDFPMPAIRFKEVTPDIQALRGKEKGDWKKLTIEEKKQLYRASFRQTFVEMEAPTGEWKMILGGVCIGTVLALWIVVWLKKYVYPPLPISFTPEYREAQLQRMRLLDMQPITGIPGGRVEV
ncbi:cytochrome c oxidase subunit 4 isoform 1, mitochondrial [Copidosoma floridanum]|uniref:cytochrome c oxidase subunit 4 isoform 1, mitochondrial n=1 Tax=Copidosoma floridanum TaxID=29053 RepID=UPI0006C95BC7|nr:cytochrome c oxidase subunit 4 isoform 1, mitochondrial [Copidosoma floridanum]XP_014206165.1 cytochrome c oxidase subunit 4 isoform 1, mitochondrial [Copidosoma floridanum]